MCYTRTLQRLTLRWEAKGSEKGRLLVPPREKRVGGGNGIEAEPTTHVKIIPAVKVRLQSVAERPS